MKNFWYTVDITLFVPFFSIYSIYDYTSIWFIVSSQKLFYCHLKKTAGSLFEQEEVSCRFFKNVKKSQIIQWYLKISYRFSLYFTHTHFAVTGVQCSHHTTRYSVWYDSQVCFIDMCIVHEREISRTTEKKKQYLNRTLPISSITER